MKPELQAAETPALGSSLPEVSAADLINTFLNYGDFSQDDVRRLLSGITKILGWPDVEDRTQLLLFSKLAFYGDRQRESLDSGVQLLREGLNTPETRPVSAAILLELLAAERSVITAINTRRAVEYRTGIQSIIGEDCASRVADAIRFQDLPEVESLIVTSNAREWVQSKIIPLRISRLLAEPERGLSEEMDTLTAYLNPGAGRTRSIRDDFQLFRALSSPENGYITEEPEVRRALSGAAERLLSNAPDNLHSVPITLDNPEAVTFVLIEALLSGASICRHLDDKIANGSIAAAVTALSHDIPIGFANQPRVIDMCAEAIAAEREDDALLALCCAPRPFTVIDALIPEVLQRLEHPYRYLAMIDADLEQPVIFKKLWQSGIDPVLILNFLINSRSFSEGLSCIGAMQRHLDSREADNLLRIGLNLPLAVRSVIDAFSFSPPLIDRSKIAGAESIHALLTDIHLSARDRFTPLIRDIENEAEALLDLDGEIGPEDEIRDLLVEKSRTLGVRLNQIISDLIEDGRLGELDAIVRSMNAYETTLILLGVIDQRKLIPATAPHVLTFPDRDRRDPDDNPEIITISIRVASPSDPVVWTAGDKIGGDAVCNSRAFHSRNSRLDCSWLVIEREDIGTVVGFGPIWLGSEESAAVVEWLQIDPYFRDDELFIRMALESFFNAATSGEARSLLPETPFPPLTAVTIGDGVMLNSILGRGRALDVDRTLPRGDSPNSEGVFGSPPVPAQHRQRILWKAT